jgi:hypothetical protein
VKNKLYETRPIIFHAQGKPEFSPFWENIKHRCQSIKIAPENLDIVTFNNGKSFFNKDNGCFENSIQNQCIVMGKNILNWKNFLKIQLTIKFLENSKKEFILSADSSDVVVYSFEKIIDIFLSKKCDLLYNAEINCWPTNDFSNLEKYRFLHPFCHLNAGVWIGKRKKAIEFYKQCESLIIENCFSEQFYVKKNYINCYPYILIDDKCEIFQTLNRVNEDYLDINID